METEIDLKKVGLYLIIPSVLSAILLYEKGFFILIGIVQFLVGLIQVLISIIKTIVYAFNSSPFPAELKFYWLGVLLYFVIGFLGAGAMAYLEIGEEIITPIALVYFTFAWTLALYHFRHIMLLKI